MVQTYVNPKTGERIQYVEGQGWVPTVSVEPKTNLPAPQKKFYRPPPTITITPGGLGISSPPKEEKISPQDELGQYRAKKLIDKELGSEDKNAPTIQAVYSNLKDYKSRLDKIPYSGKIGDLPDIMRLGGKAESWMAENVPKHNPSLLAVNKTREGFAGLMARTFGGEKGVMTDRDIARFVNFIPTYELTDDERNELWGVVDDMYANISLAMKIKQKDPERLVKVEIGDKRANIMVDGKPYSSPAKNIQTGPETKVIF